MIKMNGLGERINELRKKIGISQNELARRINVSKAQMNRYEAKGIQPPADVLNNIAEVLETSVDYLINGNADEKAKAILQKTEVLQKFKEIETLPERQQNIILDVIGAYIRDYKTKQAYAS
jgi:transcriptional regulator with XRE-family HTH domain